jgi:hypothetical protein
MAYSRGGSRTELFSDEIYLFVRTGHAENGVDRSTAQIVAQNLRCGTLKGPSWAFFSANIGKTVLCQMLQGC